MGSSLSKKSNDEKDDNKDIYRVKAKDSEVMKKVWRIIEYDISNYGSVFCTILFRNHPQYIRYFQEDDIPEFVQDARIKKKFSAVCTIIGVLFIDYSRKRHQRDHLLRYIAMIHKDMRLTHQDLQNFMMDLLEMLIQECPKEMTAECTLVHMRYFSGLLRRIGRFMQVQREKDLELLKGFEDSSENKQRCCWISQYDSPWIYGRPHEYWNAKQNYWQVRMDFWSSLDMEFSKRASYSSTEKYDDNNTLDDSKVIKGNFVNKSSSILLSQDSTNPLSRTNRQWSKLSESSASISNDNSGQDEGSDEPISRKNVKNGHNRSLSLYKGYKRSKRHKKINSISPSTSRPMETIQEVHSRAHLFENSKIVPPIRTSVKSTQAFLNTAKALKAEKNHFESDKNSSDAATDEKTQSDVPQESKRRKDKRENVIRPSMELNNSDDNLSSSTMRMMIVLASRQASSRNINNK